MQATRALARTVLLAALAGAGTAAHATLITFDDLPWTAPPGRVVDLSTPITDQYASQGILVGRGFLAQGVDASSPPQYLFGTQGLRISFIGTLPTHVDFNLSSPFSLRNASVTARGPEGFSESVLTTGHVSFSSMAGISHLFFNRVGRTSFAMGVDDLHFVTAVPEPASLALLAAGLATCFAARRGRKREPAAGN